MTTALLTPKEVAAQLSISSRTVYDWLEEGRLPAVRLSERITRVPADAVEALVANETEPATIGILAAEESAVEEPATYCASCGETLTPEQELDPTQRRRELLAQHRDEILHIAQRRRACNVRVFGSVARGDARVDSDIDLLVDLLPHASLFDLGGLNQELEDLLGIRVDVIPARGVRKRIRDRVFEEARPL